MKFRMSKKELLYESLYILVSFITAAAVALHRAINYPNWIEFLSEFSLKKIFLSPLFAVAFIVMIIVCNALPMLGKRFFNARAIESLSTETKPKWLYMLIAFVPMLCSSLLCFLVYYPATGMIDSQYIILAGAIMYKQHPYWYCLLYSELFKLAQLIFSDTYLQYAFLCVFQFTVVDIALAASAAYVRKECGTRLFFVYLLYMCALPIIALYSITLVKDTLYSVAILWLTIWLHGIIKSSAARTSPIFSFAVFFAVCATRNNGKYIILLIIIVLAIIYRSRKQILISMASFVAALIICTVPNIILDATAPQEELYQEKVGIPIQQLAATYVVGGELNESELAYYDKLFKLELLEESFDPYDVDAVKWGGVLDNTVLSQNTGEFWKNYFSVFKKNTELFVKEWLLATYGYWDGDNYFNYSQSSMFTIYKSSGIINRPLLPEGIVEPLNSLYQRFAIFFTGGECLLALLCFSLLLIRTNRKELILLCLPLILNTLSLFAAAPIALGYRYIIANAYVAPLLFAFLFAAMQNDEKMRHDE